MYLSGVVISDDYDDDQDVVVANDPYDQIYDFQQYGDDGILDGAEGFGVMQAKALKAKLTRGRAGRRRLGVGKRAAYQIVGMSPMYDGFGIAPLAIAGAGISAVKKLGNIFKTPSEKRAAKVIGKVITSANNGNLNAVGILDSRRYLGIAKERAVWSKGYSQVSPSVLTAYAPVASVVKASIPASAQANPEAAASWAVSNVRNAVTGPTTSGGPIVSVTPIVPGAPAPAPGPVTDAAGGTAPYLPPSPSPIPSSSGGSLTPTETVAAQTQDENAPEIQEAGMFGSFDPKLLLIGGAIALAVNLLSNKGGRRRRR